MNKIYDFIIATNDDIKIYPKIMIYSTKIYNITYQNYDL